MDLEERGGRRIDGVLPGRRKREVVDNGAGDRTAPYTTNLPIVQFL